jgi:hypothetical protein
MPFKVCSLACELGLGLFSVENTALLSQMIFRPPRIICTSERVRAEWL